MKGGGMMKYVSIGVFMFAVGLILDVGLQDFLEKKCVFQNSDVLVKMFTIFLYVVLCVLIFLHIVINDVPDHIAAFNWQIDV